MRGIHQNFDQQPAPAFFVRGPSPVARLMFFTALSLALMATDSRLQYLSNVRQTLMSLLQPLQIVASAPSELYAFTSEYFSTHHHLLAENQQLKTQALRQAVDLQKLRLLSLENENLRDLLRAQQSFTEVSTLAEIEYVGRDAFTKKVVVNRGTNHLIVTGAAAVDAKGVIGQVTRTYPTSSEVTLITDKSLAIPVQLQRNGLRAIAFGHGRNNTLELPYLPANVDINVGDELVTSGIDGVYPPGLAVASVIEVETSPASPFARIICVPTAGIEHSRQVLLISIPKPKPGNNPKQSLNQNTKVPSPAEKANVPTSQPIAPRQADIKPADSSLPNTEPATAKKPAAKEKRAGYA